MTTVNICKVINDLGMGILHNKNSITIAECEHNKAITQLLLQEKIINSAIKLDNKWVLTLKKNHGLQVFRKPMLISKPSWKKVVSKNVLKPLIHKNPSSIFVIATDKDLKTGKEALLRGVGGELLFRIDRI